MTRDQLLAQTVLNPNTQRKVKVGYALKLPKEHPAYKAARALIQQSLPNRPEMPEPSKLQPLADEKFRDIVLDAPQDSGPMSLRQRERLDSFGEKLLNGVSPIDICAAYLQALGVTNSSEIRVVDFATSDPERIERTNSGQLTVSITLKNGTYINRVIVSRLKGSTREVDISNDTFILGQDVKKGTGHGRRMLQATMRIADRIGAERVTFEATLASGGYVWARYGGIPDPSSRPKIYKVIHKRLSNIESTIEQRLESLYQDAQALAEEADLLPPDHHAHPRIAKRLAGIQKRFKELEELKEGIKNNPEEVAMLMELVNAELAKVPDDSGEALSGELLAYLANTKFGKLLLLGTSWYGHFDMRKGTWGRQMLEATVGQEN